mmetsp:Transcript_23247/g.58774  ORF Transcript_23247/g.58774 Transcript_23247/m.58774 type:complete len:850 (+) Transcript_23247:244-2793(+)
MAVLRTSNCGAGTASAAPDPRKLIEAVADVLSAAHLDAGNALRGQKHEISKKLLAETQKEEKFQQWLDAVRCLQSISTSYLTEAEEEDSASPELMGGGGGGNRRKSFFRETAERRKLPGTRSGDLAAGVVVSCGAPDALSTEIHAFCTSIQAPGPDGAQVRAVTENELMHQVDAIMGLGLPNSTSASPSNKVNPRNGFEHYPWVDTLQNAEGGAGSSTASQRNKHRAQVLSSSSSASNSNSHSNVGGDEDDEHHRQESIAGTAIITGGAAHAHATLAARRGGAPANKISETEEQGTVIDLPSGFYTMRKRPSPEVSYATPEDEYHDDDDPGYRIRELSEEELMEELRNSEPFQKLPGEESSPPATASRPVEDVEDAAGIDDPIRRVPWADNTASAPKKKKRKTSSAALSGATAGTSHQVCDAASAGDSASAAASTSAAAAGLTTQARGRLNRIVGSSSRTQHGGSSSSTSSKNAAFNTVDNFYPVSMNDIVYDCFPLRVVFERDRTGFEESKELKIEIGQILAARYQVVEFLGQAAFSRAVQCHDLELNRMVCLKIIKNEKDFVDQSLDEIKLLTYIQNCCKSVDEENVLRLLDFFYYKEHLILVTELLKDNLYEFSKFNRENGQAPYFTKGRLQTISRDILRALDYIHGLDLIHCDLKPENILMKSYSRTEVKVIDFGSSCFIDDHLSSYVQSRSYRAPEVILGCAYDQKIDIWSLGCILAELWTGYVLFQNDSVHSLLARVLGILGRFPFWIMASGRHVPQYFTQDGRLYQEVKLDLDGNDTADKRLHLLVPKRTSLGHRLSLPDDDPFLDFMQQMLCLDPSKRPTAAECLQHPFLTHVHYLEQEMM